MNCDEFDRLFDRYLAGELTEAEALAVEAHASQCERCERRLDAATAIREVVPVLMPPAHVRARVLGAAAAGRRTAMRRRWLVGAAAAAAVAAVGLSIGPERKHAFDVRSATHLFAIDRAKPEFEELDRAARELESALRESPDDPELKQYLATVNDRRDALTRRISEASL